MFSLQVPQSENRWKPVARVQNGVAFPTLIRSIEGKHVEICKPPGTRTYYFNY
jgi:hypothetical protein